MLKLSDVFHKEHVLIVVIHAVDIEQVLRNMTIAQDNGADGVFFINHHITPDQLLGIHILAKQYFPKLWIGINILGVEPNTVLEISHKPLNGIWADDAGIHEDAVYVKAERFRKNREHRNWQGIYFGGVAFKGQKPVTMANLANVAKSAVPYVDVITTSGSVSLITLHQLYQELEYLVTILHPKYTQSFSEYPEANSFNEKLRTAKI